MKKLSTLVVLVLAAGTLWAQPKSTTSVRDLSYYATALELSEAQRVEIERVYQATADKLAALGEHNVPARDRRAERVAIYQERQRQLQTVLSPEQWTQLTELRAAHRAKHRRQWSAIDKEGLRRELAAYRQEKVEPVIKEVRRQFDQQISAEDRATISQLREELADRPKRSRSQAEEKHAPTERQKQCELLQAWRAEHEADRQMVMALVERYAAEIDEVFTELAPRKAEWKAGMKKIKQKYIPTTEHDTAHHLHRRKKHGRSPHSACSGAKKAAAGEDHRLNMHRARFLLLDFAAPAVPTKPVSGAAMALQLAPNPLRSAGTVQLEVFTPGKIRVDLIAQNGRVLRALTDKSFATGVHQLPFDVEGLSSGRYTIRAVSAAGTVSTAVIISE